MESWRKSFAKYLFIYFIYIYFFVDAWLYEGVIEKFGGKVLRIVVGGGREGDGKEAHEKLLMIND